ncbi:winged helix-turn-helix domain-containing protein [Kineosporia sp. NBRC 101731]|uniref:winged helix-turn-helix domain-containing protein n=1 Tax=Kineosporia sp. NBRC 101731 TaxID=3032199 RepID=UPI00255260A9|nr:winged helix-turn-helix domain-containing protein [Kineosporia sp. NBRC 101731]
MPLSPYRSLADRIAARILAGQYPPGQRLPRPGDLEQEGHPPETVREALRWLVEQGWAEIGPHGGYFVTDNGPSSGLDWDTLQAGVEAHLRRATQ